MSDSRPPVEIGLRIPGKWASPRELIEALPAGFRFTPEALILPDKTRIDFGAMDADDQFAEIFRSCCRQPATAEEFATVDSYTVNVVLSGSGGSLDAARKMMQAAGAIIQAGGAGVFIDNCGLAHGGGAWVEMTDDGGPDAVSFAFVALISDHIHVWTTGMHVMGFREIIMKRVDADEFDIVEVIRYVCGSENPVEDGHVIADTKGPRFRTLAEDGDKALAGSPMYNPFGRLRLVSLRDIAENN